MCEVDPVEDTPALKGGATRFPEGALLLGTADLKSLSLFEPAEPFRGIHLAVRVPELPNRGIGGLTDWAHCRTVRSHRWKAIIRLIGVGLSCLGLAACSSGGRGLDGTTWKLSGWTLDSLEPAAFTITAKFADAKISGRSAVNSYSGSYTVSSNGAFAVGQIASTQMAGPEPAMRAERAYLTLLQQARSYSLAGRTLTLFDEHGNESLIFARASR